MAILASIGSVGVPGAALIVMTMVFNRWAAHGRIALVAGWTESWIWPEHLEYPGDAVGAVVVSQSEGELAAPTPQLQDKPGVIDKAGLASLIFLQVL